MSKLDVLEEWIRSVTATSTVSRHRCSGIYPLKRNMIQEIYLLQTPSQFNQAIGGYAQHFWATYRNILTSLGFPSKKRTKASSLQSIHEFVPL